jgi:hypothetical protein
VSDSPRSRPLNRQPRPGDRPDGVWPNECPNGHPLGAGRVQLGWSPCQCPTALVRHRGHTTYRCLACEQAGWTSIAYQPEHIRTATEADQELDWLRRHLQRLETGLTQMGSTDPGQQRSLAEAKRYRLAVAKGEQVVAGRRIVERARSATRA